MGYITNHLNKPEHIYQVVNNAMVGGNVTASVTGAGNATGGLAVATSSNNGRCTITYDAFATAPMLVASPGGTASGQVTLSVPILHNVGVSSAGVVCAVINSSGGTATAAYPVNIIGYGANTGTRIT